MKTARPRRGLRVAASALLLVTPVAVAPAMEVIDSFDAPPDPEWWTLSGDATWDSSSESIFLTVASNDQTGSIFFPWKMRTQRFYASFDFWMGGGTGGEGFTFAWVKGPHFLGGVGGSLGLDGLDGYAIRFDAHSNDAGEPQNYIAFCRSSSEGREDPIVNSALPGMADTIDAEGNRAPFHVEVLVEDGHLVVWMGNPSATTPMLKTKVVNRDIPDYAPFEGYFGFTAATSDSNNIHAIDNVEISEYRMEPDNVVYGGTPVTLRASAPNAISYTWRQIAGEPIVPLDVPAPGVCRFIAPEVTVGTILTFELTVVFSDGQESETLDIVVRANNRPMVTPSNLRALPIDRGFILTWDHLIDADEYVVEIEAGPGLWFELATIARPSYTFRDPPPGTMVLARVKARNQFGDSDASEVLRFVAMRNLALPETAGGATPPSELVCKVCPPSPPPPVWVGICDGIYDDPWDSYDGNSKDEDYWGYLWDEPLVFDWIVYYTGEIRFDGGWWTDLTVQYTEDGATWIEAPGMKIDPPYDFTNAPANRSRFTRYDISFLPVRGTGIRIYGTPGGLATYTSIAELEVYGDQTRQWQPPRYEMEVWERTVVRLDGQWVVWSPDRTYYYRWEQISGPTVELENPDRPVATFTAPSVDADALLVFKLTISDGSQECTVNFSVTVKDIETKAEAGPGQLAREGVEVTLDGSGSLSSSGALIYQWRQVSGPAVTLNNPTGAVCTFTAPAIWSHTKRLTFRLQVDDGLGRPDSISTDEVNVNVLNSLFDIRPLGIGYFHDLLHLGQRPEDRILGPLWPELGPKEFLYLPWGSWATINPVEGEAYDFTDTGIATTVNPMIWTPEHSDNGFFAWDERLDGNFRNFTQVHHIYIFSPEERQARFRFRHDDEIRLWNNGVLAVARDGWDGGTEVWANFTLFEGVNSMTLMFEEGTRGNYIACRITDRNDLPYTDLSYALSVPNPLPTAYAVRTLPRSYTAGGAIDVEISLRADPDNLPTSMTVSEPVPQGLSVADAGGGQVIGGSINWILTGAQVGIHKINYSLSVPAGTAGALNFAGDIDYGTVSNQEIWGDKVIYGVPSEAGGLTVEVLGAAHLSWSPSTTPGVVGYNVYRSVDGGPWEKIAYVTGTSYSHKWLPEGVIYCYGVAAVNASGVEGEMSNVACQNTSEKLTEIREAEDFNYGGGLYPWKAGTTILANEAPYKDAVYCVYDFWHPNKGGPRTYRPLDAVGIETMAEADNPALTHTSIGWIDEGSWWKYTFDVPRSGWIKLVFRVASPGRGTLAAYWDEQLMGTITYLTGNWHIFTYAAMEEQMATTTGEHVLRVEFVSGQLNFDKIVIGYDWSYPPRQTIWKDDFEQYTSLYVYDDLVAAGWTVVNGSGYPNAAWRLWNISGDPLGNEAPDIAGMTGNYVITDSDLEGEADMNEGLITPEIDCADYVKVRLDFNKNHRVYADDIEYDQVAEVDIRVREPDAGWGEWHNLLHFDRTTNVDIDSAPERLDISLFADHNKIQVRLHFYDAKYDYWFAVDNIVVSGEYGCCMRPKVAGFGKVGNDITLTWNAFGNGQYTVQYTGNLVGGTWQNPPGTWPTTNTSATLSAQIGAAAKRYYRVVAGEAP